jgi:Ni/Co efflux regulator RcnB
VHGGYLSAIFRTCDMRKLLISTAIIGFFALPALAQPDHDQGHGGPQPQAHGGTQPQAHGGPTVGGPHTQPGPHPTVSPNGGRNSGRPTMTSNPAYNRGPSGGGFNQTSPGTNPAYSRGPNGSGNLRPQGASNMAGHPGVGFNRPSGGGQRHDFHGFVDFHQNFTAPRHFHAGAYRRPAGWYSHQWAFGEFLPAAFWARDYWLVDFMDFGLPPPPYGAVWVRVGNDALLIDQGTGEIITVEYGLFY